MWYSQRITEHLGTKRFEDYIRLFKYGNQDVSGNPGRDDGLTQAWLTSSLRISPFEQLTFLGRLVRRELPVSPQAYEMTSWLTLMDSAVDGWEVHGKTGTGFQIDPDGAIDCSRQVGWFVGWASKRGNARVFAHCIEASVQPPPNYAGPQARDALMRRSPALLAMRTWGYGQSASPSR